MGATAEPLIGLDGEPIDLPTVFLARLENATSDDPAAAERCGIVHDRLALLRLRRLGDAAGRLAALARAQQARIAILEASLQSVTGLVPGAREVRDPTPDGDAGTPISRVSDAPRPRGEAVPS